MTKKELMDMLMKYAKEYCPNAMDSIIRNRHMNDYDGEWISQDTMDALIVDFVNFIGTKQGVDLGFFTEDLKERK